jgi:hypothetical protein
MKNQESIFRHLGMFYFYFSSYQNSPDVELGSSSSLRSVRRQSDDLPLSRAHLRTLPGISSRALPLFCVAPQLAPGEHRAVWGSKRTPGHTPTRGVGSTWVTTGPARVRGDGSTLWVFWNKSARRADLRVFQSVGCRACLGVCVVPRGPQKHPSAGPWGASCHRGVKEDPWPHLSAAAPLAATWCSILPPCAAAVLVSFSLSRCPHLHEDPARLAPARVSVCMCVCV